VFYNKIDCFHFGIINKNHLRHACGVNSTKRSPLFAPTSFQMIYRWANRRENKNFLLLHNRRTLIKSFFPLTTNHQLAKEIQLNDIAVS
jgi:membrane-bound lytic murein transglycosylase MltF